MSNLWEKYKQYYIENSGYNSNQIENPDLTKKEYLEYYSEADVTDEEIKKTISEHDDNKRDNLITKIETQNFAKVVNRLFAKEIKCYGVESLKTINKILMDRLDTDEFSDKFSVLFLSKAGGIRKTQIVKRTSKGEISFLDKNFVTYDLDIINGRMKEVLDSSEYSEVQKLDEIILYHLNFEFIHPFGEGNGRTGRTIMDNQLFEIGLPSMNFKETDSNTQYLNAVANAMNKLKEQNAITHTSRIFYSVPPEFKVFCYEALKSEKENVENLGMSSIFENLNKIDFDEQIENIRNNIKELNSDWSVMQRTHYDKDFISLGLINPTDSEPED